MRVENDPKSFLEIIKKQNMQSRTISKPYTVHENAKHSFNATDVHKSAKITFEKFGAKEGTSRTTISEALNKITTKKKISKQQYEFFQLYFC